MHSRWFHRPVLHSPAHGLEKRATWLELFYDLVFVAAFIQLGNGLSDNVSLDGVLNFAGTFLQLWVAWTGFTFFVNRFTVDDFAQRALVLCQMFAVASMALSAPQASQGDPVPLAISTGIAQLLVAVMYARAYLQVPDCREYSLYWGAVFGLSALGWLSASLLPAGAAWWVCSLSTLFVLVSPLAERSRALNERLPIDFEHLAERYGLLTIIVLGESFVKLLTALSDESDTTPYLAGAEVLLLTCGVWWVYFDDIAGSHIRHGRSQWVLWLYGHIPLQLAIVALGVAVKKAVFFEWDAPAPDKYRYLLAGSLALIYFAVAVLDSVTERKHAELNDRARINARALSGLFLIVLAAAGHAMTAAVFVGLLTAVNVAQVVFDMMMAPLSEDPHAELGARTTAQVAREEIERGEPVEKTRIEPGQAIRKGTPSDLRRDLYFFLIEGSYWRLVSIFGFLFVVTNLFFAALYELDPGAIAGAQEQSLLDAFFFSVETMSTIGYGEMSPATTWAHVVVTIEAACALIGVAVVTGLVFAKISRPHSAVLFSRNLLVTHFHGKRVLMFRAGNARGNDVVDAQVHFAVLRDEFSPEGQHLRRIHDLRPLRARSPMFMLSWTVIHELDADSPLHDIDWDHPQTTISTFIVTLMGHDSTYGQTTYARHTYGCEDLRVGHRFVDVIHQLPDGRMMIDYARFHDTEPERADGDAGADPEQDLEAAELAADSGE